MAQVAENSYIHTHLIDARTGRTIAEAARIVSQANPRLNSIKTGKMAEDEAQLVRKTASHFDSIKRASPKGLIDEIAVLERISLPTPKPTPALGNSSAPSNPQSPENEGQDAYAELAAAFGKVSIAMGTSLAGQAGVFSEEQKDNNIIATEMLETQLNQISDEKQVDHTIDHIAKEQARAEKIGKILGDFSYIFMALLPLAVICVAVAPFLTSIVSTVSEMVSATAGLGTEIAETTAATVNTAVNTGAQLSGEISEMAMNAFSAAPDVVADSAVNTGLAQDLVAQSTAGAGTGATGGAGTAAGTAAETAANSAQTAGSTASRVMSGLGRALQGAVFTAAQNVSSVVEGVYNNKLAKQNFNLAEDQNELGIMVANAVLVNGAYTASQKYLQRESEIIQDLGQQSGQVVSTFGDMMKTVREATNAIAYAA